MEIKIEKNEGINFYDEFLYIVSKYRKLAKNPHKKVHKLTTDIIFYIVYLIIIGIIYLFISVETYPFILIFILSMVIILFIYLVFIFKYIKKLTENNNSSILKIDKNEIGLYKSKESVIINYDNIKYILISKYTISILPNNNSMLLISIPIEYKNEVIEALQKSGNNDLIIDNSSFYK